MLANLLPAARGQLRCARLFCTSARSAFRASQEGRADVRMPEKEGWSTAVETPVVDTPVNADLRGAIYTNPPPSDIGSPTEAAAEAVRRSEGTILRGTHPMHADTKTRTDAMSVLAAAAAGAIGGMAAGGTGAAAASGGAFGGAAGFAASKAAGVGTPAWMAEQAAPEKPPPK